MHRIFNSLVKKNATIYTQTHTGVALDLTCRPTSFFLLRSAARMLLLWVLRVYCDKWKIYYHNIRGFSISTLLRDFLFIYFRLDVSLFLPNRSCPFLVRGSYARFLPKYLSPMKSNEKWHSYGARSSLIKLTQFVWISYVRCSACISSLEHEQLATCTMKLNYSSFFLHLEWENEILGLSFWLWLQIVRERVL